MVIGGDDAAELPMSDAPRRSSLTAADMPALPLVVPDVIQKVIRVLREPGVALGMSVAGGIGALPDTHDEVRYHDQSLFFCQGFDLKIKYNNSEQLRIYHYYGSQELADTAA